VSVPGTSLK